MLLLVNGFDVLRNLVAQFLMVSLALPVFVLFVEVLVDVERAQRHVIPKLRVLREDADAHFFETFEGFVVFARSIKRQTHIEDYFMRLLGGLVAQRFIWVDFLCLLGRVTVGLVV